MLKLGQIVRALVYQNLIDKKSWMLVFDIFMALDPSFSYVHI